MSRKKKTIRIYLSNSYWNIVKNKKMMDRNDGRERIFPKKSLFVMASLMCFLFIYKRFVWCASGKQMDQGINQDRMFLLTLHLS